MAAEPVKTGKGRGGSFVPTPNPLPDVDPGRYHVRRFVDAIELQAGDDLPSGVYRPDDRRVEVGKRVTGRPVSMGNGLVHVPIGNHIVEIEADMQVLIHRPKVANK